MRRPVDTFVSADTLVATPVPWLWPPYLPLGSLVILDGDPGLGKSTIVYDLAARISTGRPMPTGSPLEGAAHVIIANAEDDPSHVIAPRLDAAGADRSRISIPAIDQAPYLDESWIGSLEQKIVETGARLLTIDPLTAFVPPGTNTYHDAEVRHVLRPVADIGRRLGCTIVMVRHPKKAEDGKALYRGGGSIGIIASARAAYVLTRDPDDPDGTTRILACTKMNLGPEPPSLKLAIEQHPELGFPIVRWLGTSEMHADDLVKIARRATRPRDLAKAFLRTALADGELATTTLLELADDEGIAEKTLQRAATDLGIVKRRIGGSDGHHAWSLPTPHELTNQDAHTPEMDR